MIRRVSRCAVLVGKSYVSAPIRTIRSCWRTVNKGERVGRRVIISWPLLEESTYPHLSARCPHLLAQQLQMNPHIPHYPHLFARLIRLESTTYMASINKTGSARMSKAFQREIRRKAHDLAFDYQEKVTDELMRLARIALLEGHDMTEVQRMIRHY